MKALRRFMALAVLIAAFTWLASAPAAAHTGFESSSPDDGETMEAPLEEVVLRFTGSAQPAGDGFVVLDPAGSIRAPDAVTSDSEQRVWTLRFDPPLVAGPVGVRWTVQAPDAHPISGTLSFTVTAPPVAAGEPTEPEEDAAAAVAISGATDPGDTVAASDADAAPPSELASTPQESPVVVGGDLDAFLEESGAPARYATHIGGVGRFAGLAGAILGTGGIVFAATVVHHRRRETAAVLRWVAVSGLVVLIGAVGELAGHVAATAGAWTDLLSPSTLRATALGSFGGAVGLRAAGGALLFAAARAQVVSLRQDWVVAALQPVMVTVGAPVGPPDGPPYPPVSPIHAGQPSLGATGPMAEPVPGWQRALSPGMALAALGLVVSFAFDGHTVSKGDRLITAVVDVAHVVAGAVWAGGVVMLAGVLWARHRRGVRLRALELAVRFSVSAAIALVAAGLAGTVLAITILDTPSELWSTSWGQLLLLKVLAVAGAAALGGYNHFKVIPWMNADPDDDSRSIRLRNTVTAEAALLALVVAITALLVAAAS